MEKESPRKETMVLERLQLVKDEIKRYPTPIAGCDEQFNFLLSERVRLTLELTEILRSPYERKDLKRRDGELSAKAK